MHLRVTTTILIGVLLIGSVVAPLRAAPSEACSLLTQANVSAALGVAIGAGQQIAGPSTCGWSAQGKRVTLTITRPAAGQSPVDRFNSGKTPIIGVTNEPAAGVGDDAYYVYFTKAPNSGTGLVVRKGSFVFEIRVYGFALDQAKTIAKTLAQALTGRV